MKLEFWFDFASNYSYLSVMRLRQLGQTDVVWRPFLLGPIFKDAGWNNSPFVLQKDKGAYVWQDMPRQCAKYGLPWRQPSTFPRNSLLAARIGILCEEQPWMLDFCERTMLANFADDRDISNEQCMSEILSALGQDAEAILRAALADDNKARLRARTEQAKAHRIFGAPTFLVGDAMFWGNDRLDDALAMALSSPQGLRKTAG
ncbi:2-hydroxychromene-2-carboxylate isomerase [Rugamonas aquatica]|uniref:2-hydroxychromene-2-carboxylate isomerase n=1 Tax=Rugamonas aquatica TaxID=2743357 RepID=A0A6A7N7V3_9BURK|nr:2-hydroxychromene-2-carboxylate isomerase [Rugamonas aquatica]MQA41109.1 2-hydroxychromene-2-carboxylate isomerase [Rugamonas aquatica]